MDTHRRVATTGEFDTSLAAQAHIVNRDSESILSGDGLSADFMAEMALGAQPKPKRSFARGEKNVGSVDRALSLAGGAALLGLMLRKTNYKSAGGVSLGILASGLFYRGLSGHCPIYGQLKKSTTNFDFKQLRSMLVDKANVLSSRAGELSGKVNETAHRISETATEVAQKTREIAEGVQKVSEEIHTNLAQSAEKTASSFQQETDQKMKFSAENFPDDSQDFGRIDDSQESSPIDDSQDFSPIDDSQDFSPKEDSSAKKTFKKSDKKSSKSNQSNV